MERLHLKVSGLVQGVFFRANTRDEALKLGLTGFVRNLPDGSVEIVAEGDREILDELLRWCQKGPRISRVDHLDHTWDKTDGSFDTFEIAY